MSSGLESCNELRMRKKIIASLVSLLSIPEIIRIMDGILRIVGIAKLPDDVASLFGLLSGLSNSTSFVLMLFGLLGIGYLASDISWVQRARPIRRPGMGPTTLMSLGFLILALGGIWWLAQQSWELTSISENPKAQTDAGQRDAVEQSNRIPELRIKQILAALETYRGWMNGEVYDAYKNGISLHSNWDKAAGLG
jgi:hypothetical protein